MSAKVLLCGAAVAVSTMACGYEIKTATDYDSSIRFSNYHSFSILKGNSSGNPLMDQRAQDDVVSALASKAWIDVPAADAQATVVVHAATSTKHTYETLYDGWGGWGWRRGWGGRFGGGTTFVIDYKVGTLVVDIFDAKSKEAIWHGTASDALSDSAKSNAKATERAVDKMFRNFPPGSPMAKGL